MRTKLAAIAAALAATPAFAQVATDGSVGARTTLAGPRFNVADTLGTRVGRNLIHSFSQFNIRAGEQATFTGFSVIDNIIARITGGSPSLIDGAVRVEMAGANLFLVNPSGLVFGPGASIDVPGAFYASTAQTMRFADGSVVDMRAASPVSLTAAPPSAFGFDTAGAAITLQGAQLRAREGRRVALLGGDISLGRSVAGRAPVLAAPSGAVDLVATRGAGSVAIGDRLDPSGFSSMGDVSLGAGSTLSASEGTGRLGGGTVFVRGGNVTLDRATVESRTRFADARGIDIGATERLTVDASNVLAVTTGAGNAGYLRLAGRDIAIGGGSLVDTSCDPGCSTGRGGELSITAGNGLTITGNDPNLPTFVVSNSFGGGSTGPITITTGGALSMSGTSFIQGIGLAGGDGSTITLRTGSIDLSGGAQVDASTRGAGRGGSITVENRGDIRISGSRLDPTQEDPDTKGPLKLPSGFFANAGRLENSNRQGDAGSIVISTANLSVLAGGEISSTAQRGSLGQGGSVTVRATGTVSVDGRDETGKSSGIVANTFSLGDAGTLDITADRLEVTNDGRIQSLTESSGDGGSIRVRARQVVLDSGGQIASDTRAATAGGRGGTIEVTATESVVARGGTSRPTGLVINGVPEIEFTPSGLFANTEGSGDGGSIAVAAPDVRLSGGAEFSSTAIAGSSGDGGRIDVRASKLLRVEGTAPTGKPSGIVSNTFAPGDGGEIFLQAPRIEVAEDGSIQSLTAGIAGRAGVIRVRGGDLSITSGGTLLAETRGLGNAGLIDIALDGALSIVGDGRVRTFSDDTNQVSSISVPRTGIFSQTSAGGTGGVVRVNARNLLVDAGSIVGGSFRDGLSLGAEGNSGSLSLSIPGNLTVRSGSVLTTFSLIANGNAGNIAIQVGDTLRVDSGSRISTESRISDGGNIAIEVGNLAILESAAVTTAVKALTGTGGNIAFLTPTLAQNRSTISANAFGGPGGNIRIGAQSFFKSADSAVTASSVLSVDGTITFDSPALDPTGELLAPPPVFLDAGAVLAGRCGPRLAGRASSLVVLPRSNDVRYPDEMRPALDGRPMGFLTRPAPQACAPETPARIAQVAR